MDFFSSRRRHTRYWRDWSSDVCSSDLQVRGPWVTSGYFKDESDEVRITDDGWFCTGDVAEVIDHGFLRLVDDRKRAVVGKSVALGGRRISNKKQLQSINLTKYRSTNR